MAWRWTVAAALLPLAACAMQTTGRAPRHTGMGRGASAVDVRALGLEEVEGVLQRIDPHAGEVVVDGLRLEVNGEASVFVDGGVGELGDLQEGEPVRASFALEEGRRVVRWIELPRPEDARKRRRPMQPAETEVAR